MDRPKTNNLTAWIQGRNLNVFQKADAVIEYNHLLDYISEKEQLLIHSVVQPLNATYKKGDDVILDTGLKAEILGFKNNLAIVIDERGLKFYKQLHKIKHQ